MGEISSGVATLLGALVGGGVSVTTMWLQFRKERRTWWDSSRKESYARFLGASHAYFLSLMDLRYGLKRSPADIDGLYRHANQLRSHLVMAMAEVDLVARAQTRAAGRQVIDHLSATNDSLFDAKREGSGPELPAYRDFDSDYQAVVSTFVDAATADIRVGR